MGVKSLWSLLTPVGRPVMLETMEGKVMAIDSSIWLYQFQATMRDKEGNVLNNAHVLGFLRRICKLLFYGIKPVFVFDGGAPVLKRSTLNERRKKKSGASASHARVAEKLLAAQLRREALNHTRPIKTTSKGKGKAPPVILDENTVFMEDLENPNNAGVSPAKSGTDSPAKKKRYPDHDPYRLPDIDFEARVAKATGSVAPDPRLATEDELRAFIEEMRPEDFDVTSSAFRELPTEVQYEIVGDLRLKSRQSSFVRLQQMLQSAPTPLDFSKQQIKNLKQRNTLTQQLLVTTDSIGKAHLSIPVRIASERNKQYVLVRHEGPEGGWVLGIRDDGTQEKPIVIDHDDDEKPEETTRTTPSVVDSDDSDEMEMEEVSIPVQTPMDPDLRSFQQENALRALNARQGRNHGKIVPLFVESDDEDQAALDEDQDVAIALQQSYDNPSSLERNILEYGEDQDDLESAIQQSLGARPPSPLLASKQPIASSSKLPPLSTQSPKLRRSIGETHEESSTLPTEESAFHGTSRLLTALSIAGAGPRSFGPPILLRSKPADHKPVSSDLMNREGGGVVRGASRVASQPIHPSPPVGTSPSRERPIKTPSPVTEEFDTEKQLDAEVPVASMASPESSEDMEEVAPAFDTVSAEMLPSVGSGTDEEIHVDAQIEQSRLQPQNITGNQPSLMAMPTFAPEPSVPLVTFDLTDSEEEWGFPKPEEILYSSSTSQIPNGTSAAENVHEDWDAAHEIDADAEEGEFANFLSQVKGRNVDDVRREIDEEIRDLHNQRKAAARDSEDITQQMTTQIMTMLRLFGIPYITAPMEAEAQCAELVSLGLTDGVITDDSDVFLFGAHRVFKNMFNQSKTVECFLLTDLDRELGLDRGTLIRLAYLLGSDYTDGLPGVGPVIAMELLKEFPGDDGLHKFREWWLKVQSGKDKDSDNKSSFRRRFKKKFKELYLTEEWPNSEVRDAYYHPVIDNSEEPFKWGLPDLDALRMFFADELGWRQTKVDELLVPIIKKMGRRGQGPSGQGNLNAFFDVSSGSGSAPRKRQAYASKRLQQVVSDFRSKRKKALSGEATEDSPVGSEKEETEEPPRKKAKAKPKAKAKAKETARGTGRGRGRGRSRGGARQTRDSEQVSDSSEEEYQDGREGPAEIPLSVELRPRPQHNIPEQ